MSRFMGILLALWVAVAVPTALAAGSSTTPAALGHEPVILVFGDSISAGYGIRVEHGWVNLLAQKITQLGYGFRVVNASVSGETTAGGLGRLPHTLEVQHPNILILELGGNDGLRSLPLETTHDNLDKMIQLARAQGVQVVLVGMRMPPNYGERYTSGFQKMYTDLAQQYQLPLVPFLLEKVALTPTLMQADGIHPTEPAEPLLLDTVWPKLEPLLGSRKP
jgi:acyl-CoA thioesterase-1